MKHNYNEAFLKSAIRKQETEVALQEAFLRARFHSTYESLTPAHLLKTALSEAIQDGAFKRNAVNAAIGLSAGFITRKVVALTGKGFLSQLGGKLLEVGVSLLATRNAESIKAAGSRIIEKTFERKFPNT
jgi:hypothetical protein